MIKENLDPREEKSEPNSAGRTGGGAVLDVAPCFFVGETATIINGPKDWIGMVVEITMASKCADGPPAFGHPLLHCQNHARRFYQWIPKCWLKMHGENAKVHPIEETETKL